MTTLAPVLADSVEIVRWVDAAGAPHTLQSDTPGNIFLRPGRMGWWAPQSRMLTQELALQPGAAFRATKDLVRQVDLPLYIDITEPAAARSAARLLAQWFDPNAGEGWLQVEYTAGVRQLRARPVGLAFGESDAMLTTPRVVVASLMALHPYWQDETATETTFSPGDGAGSFFPWPPLTLSPSSLFGQATVANGGDVVAWPIWTITGPASDIVLTNATTGEVFALRTAYSLGAGETLTIDTRPLVRTVTDQSGNRIFGYQEPTSVLWSLAAGNNDVRVQMGGIDAGSTLATLSYTQEYRAP